MSDRMPPHNRDAERSTLGSMMRDNSTIDEVFAIVTKESFYFDAHQKIFAAAADLHRGGKPVDAVTIAQRLNEKKQFDDVGRSPYLAELWECSPTAANAEYYARIVQSHAASRSIIHACTQALRNAYDVPPDEVMATLKQEMDAIAESGVIGGPVHASVVRVEVEQALDDRMKRGGDGRAIPTGFVDMDDLMPGLHDTELILVAARTSVGKSTYAMNLVHNITIKQAVPTLFISLEQRRTELVERLICLTARVDSNYIRRGVVPADDLQSFLTGGDEVSRCPLWIDHTPIQRMSRIAATAKKFQRQHGIRLVIVDYGGLIEPDQKDLKRYEQVSDISRRLKLLARDLSIPVVCLVQVNRGPENRANDRPRLSDLRESGSWEQDSDAVLFLHRPRADDKSDKPHESMIELILAKQRNGPTGSIVLHYDRPTGRFTNHQRDFS